MHHVVPKVYLRQFLIDGGKGGRFVWCYDFSNQYERRPRRLGINHKVFKSADYYTDPRYSDPHVFEKGLLGGLIEPMYHQIMTEVNSERLPRLARENLLNWLSVAKFRSPFMREHVKRFMQQYYNLANRMTGRNLTPEQEAALQRHIAQASKEVQLDAMTDSEVAVKRTQDTFAILNAKHWRILRSSSQIPFWTSDNPGFSPNMDPRFAVERPFHHVMELNADSVIYYVLSSRYCLEIEPFRQGTPLTEEWCALNMDITFEDASPEEIDFINRGTFHTRHKLLISDSKELLDRCIGAEPLG